MNKFQISIIDIYGYVIVVYLDGDEIEGMEESDI